jgi:hypothetical protein
MNTKGHYDVKYWQDGARAGQVNALTCAHCPFFVKVAPLFKGGDKSGQGRYNRARAVIVKHLHKKHRAELVPRQMTQELYDRIAGEGLQARLRGQPMKTPKRIDAYVHATPPLACACPEHPEGANFYASVIESPDRGPDSKMVLAAGPFATHADALAVVDKVRAVVLAKWNPGGRAAWYGFGTVAMAPEFTRPGKLNAELAA